MKKYEFRDKALMEIFNLICKDSKKLKFAKLDIEKKAHSYYVKYNYFGNRSILIVIRNTALIEYYIRLHNQFDTTHVTYFEPTPENLEKVDDEFFIKLKADFKELIKNMTSEEY